MGEGAPSEGVHPSSRRLLPLNAIMALLQPHELWPPLLQRAGYRLAGLEIPVKTEASDAVLDLVAVHDATNHLLVVEAKSGANIEGPQARKLFELDANAVATNAAVELRGELRPTVEVAYCCLEEHRARILLGLEQAAVALPLLVVGDRLERAGSEFEVDELQSAFSSPVDLPGPPPQIVRFDGDSTVAELQPAILAELVACAANMVELVRLPTLTEQAVPLYPFFGTRARGAVYTKAKEAARQAAEGHQHFRYRRSTAGDAEPAVEIVQSPEASDPRGRTQGYQALARRAGQAPAAATDRRQMSLFEEFDELGEADETDEDEGAEDG